MAEQTPPEERADAEHLADALLAVVEADAETTAGERDLPDVLHTAALAFRRLGIDFVHLGPAYQHAAAVVSRALSR